MFKLYILISQHGCVRHTVQLPALCAVWVVKLVLVGFFFMSVSMPVLANNELHILTCSECIDSEVVESVESLHKLQIRFSYVESDQTHDEAVIWVKAQEYDLFPTTSFQVETDAVAYFRGTLGKAFRKDQLPGGLDSRMGLLYIGELA